MLLSSSDEEDDEDADDDEDSDAEVADVWGGPEGHESVAVIDDPTRRFAICNMDWDRVSAQDLYSAFCLRLVARICLNFAGDAVLAASFKPASGVIESVVVFPSEFGLEQMAKENVSGPGAVTETKEKVVKGKLPPVQVFSFLI